MKKHLLIAGIAAGIIVIAAGGVAVNAATLAAVPSSKLGNVPAVISDDRGVDRTPSPAPSAGTEPGDDNLPRHSGQDDAVGHDAGDDHGGATPTPAPAPSAPAPPAPTDDSDHGGANDSHHGGSDDSGSGSDDSGRGGGRDD